MHAAVITANSNTTTRASRQKCTASSVPQLALLCGDTLGYRTARRCRGVGACERSSTFAKIIVSTILDAEGTSLARKKLGEMLIEAGVLDALLIDKGIATREEILERIK